LIIYLHGRSLRGDDLTELKRYGLPATVERRRDFPFVVVSPQLPSGSWPTKSLLALFDEVMAKYRVDPDRVYLTGVSLGAGAAWYVAAADPNRFAAFAPVCGAADSDLAPKLTKLKIWAFHGAKDEITPLKDIQPLIDAIQERGGSASLSIDPEGNHGNVITPVYANENLYRWFLRNRRGQPAPDVEPFGPFTRTDTPKSKAVELKTEEKAAGRKSTHSVGSSWLNMSFE
jgi:predicted peptidase